MNRLASRVTVMATLSFALSTSMSTGSETCSNCASSTGPGVVIVDSCRVLPVSISTVPIKPQRFLNLLSTWRIK